MPTRQEGNAAAISLSTEASSWSSKNKVRAVERGVEVPERAAERIVRNANR